MNKFEIIPDSETCVEADSGILRQLLFDSTGRDAATDGSELRSE